MNNVLKTKDKIILFPLWLLSLFPMKVLYMKSWFLYVLLYHVFGYRRKVVYENLRRSFPDKEEQEIRKIARGYYRHLCDGIFEVVHMISMKQDDVDKRYKIINPELINELYKENKSIVVTGSHYGNWEWASYVGHLFRYKLLGVYKPVSNRMINRFFIYIRGKQGGIPTPMKGTLRAIMDAQRNKENFMLYLVGDQRPQWGDLKYWATFMGQEAPIITGPEKLARRFNLVTIFSDVKRIKRGYYELTLRIISKESKNTQDFEITKEYIKLVEEQIKREPELYLWSHKRWKYNKEEILGAKKQSHG